MKRADLDPVTIRVAAAILPATRVIHELQPVHRVPLIAGPIGRRLISEIRHPVVTVADDHHYHQRDCIRPRHAECLRIIRDLCVMIRVMHL